MVGEDRMALAVALENIAAGGSARRLQDIKGTSAADYLRKAGSACAHLHREALAGWRAKVRPSVHLVSGFCQRKGPPHGEDFGTWNLLAMVDEETRLVVDFAIVRPGDEEAKRSELRKMIRYLAGKDVPTEMRSLLCTTCAADGAAPCRTLPAWMTEIMTTGYKDRVALQVALWMRTVLHNREGVGEASPIAPVRLRRGAIARIDMGRYPTFHAVVGFLAGEAQPSASATTDSKDEAVDSSQTDVPIGCARCRGILRAIRTVLQPTRSSLMRVTRTLEADDHDCLSTLAEAKLVHGYGASFRLGPKPQHKRRGEVQEPVVETRPPPPVEVEVEVEKEPEPPPAPAPKATAPVTPNPPPKPETPVLPKPPPKEVACAFCGVPRSKVARLIAAEDGTCICEHCVAKGVDLLCRESIEIEPVKKERTKAQMLQHEAEAARAALSLAEEMRKTAEDEKARMQLRVNELERDLRDARLRSDAFEMEALEARRAAAAVQSVRLPPQYDLDVVPKSRTDALRWLGQLVMALGRVEMPLAVATKMAGGAAAPLVQELATMRLSVLGAWISGGGHEADGEGSATAAGRARDRADGAEARRGEAQADA